ncbi:MAG: N(4)-(beta-N-acetylglucosaminyl)-L-asparaginase, partial [Bombilactobacillus sp.]
FVHKLKKRYGKAGEFSLIALNNKGEWGVATNVEFTFSIASEQQNPQILIAHPAQQQTTKIESVTQDWMDAYEKRIKASLE